MEIFELGWRITTAKYKGGHTGYISAAKSYAHTWCSINGIIPKEISIRAEHEGTHVVLVTTIEGLSTGERKEITTVESDYEQPAVEQESSEQTEEPEAEEYAWVYVRDLGAGDEVATARKRLGKVTDLQVDPQTSRLLLYLDGQTQPVVYSKNDRVRKKQ